MQHISTAAESQVTALLAQAEAAFLRGQEEARREKDRGVAEKHGKVTELEQLINEMQYAQADEMHEAQSTHEAQLAKCAAV